MGPDSKPAAAPVALLTIDHVAKRNALDPALFDALCRAIERAAREGARAAVLTGAGPTFSAGYDIRALPEEPDSDWLRGHGPLAAALHAVSQGPLPVIAALNGPAIGAGCELALACDLRVGHPGVQLLMPPVRMGLVYTPLGVARLCALCGLARAREILLLAQPVEAADALALGLLNRLVPAEEVQATALELARKVAAMPPLAVRGTRVLMEALLSQQGGSALPAAVDAEILALREAAWRSPESRAARAAFRSRR
ncbi:MAG: enoyl-CoA hydratase/isomerase family protein [Polyangia bacterium]